MNWDNTKYYTYLTGDGRFDHFTYMDDNGEVTMVWLHEHEGLREPLKENDFPYAEFPEPVPELIEMYNRYTTEKVISQFRGQLEDIIGLEDLA
jgi:hypothetical protein